MAASGGARPDIGGPAARLLLGAVVIWLGLTVVRSGVKSVREWRRSTSASAMSVDEAIATGELARIRGRARPVRPNDALTSPISRSECVAYEYSVTRQVQGTGSPSIDSGVEQIPFVVSDGTATVLVDPDADSLSLATATERVTSREELLERVDSDRVDLDSLGAAWDSGRITKPIELREGTVGVGERVTVVGRATSAREGTHADADAVMTAEGGILTLGSDDTGNVALKRAARGAFLLLLGSLLSGYAVLVLASAVAEVL
jgi:hypothetical protein